MKTRLIPILRGLTALAGPITAQQDPDTLVRAGAPVRLHLSGGPRGDYVLTGSLVALTADSVTVVPSARTERSAYPRARLVAMEVSVRERAGGAPVIRSALAGAAMGAMVGALIGLASGSDEPGFMSFSAEDKALMGGAAGAAIGLVGGLVVGVAGSQRTVERWREVDLSRLGVDQAP